MKILLHLCCGPCTIYPLQVLRDEGVEVHGYFYNPNIHPYQEWQRRRQTLVEYAATVSLPLSAPDSYDLEDFLRQVVFREAARCPFCYALRLQATARLAKAQNFDAFSSTLLYSRYQQHDRIREIGTQIGREVGIPFYYADFRRGWLQGIEESKRLGMYRQQYCGCIYSEKDRYCRHGAGMREKG
ncbi:MAG: epoxyqueuosine reductase QueH [Desulfobacca sp.]|uniref:epoxyqueuosine reductase QueH n=1 Tax=Desulfobacca sp. TaxID=2067990 RepID=UPI00404B3B4D